MTFCPWCHKDLGDGKTALSRHRRQCEFRPATPWGVWQEKFMYWISRRTRMQGEAYANLARILFSALSPAASRASYLAAQELQLRQNLVEDEDAKVELDRLIRETPYPLKNDGNERLRTLKTQVVVLDARFDELKIIKRFLEERR